MDKGDGMSKETLSVWTSALLKSAKLIFPMLIFSVFFARPIMMCMYGDMYAQSSAYFVIKNLGGLLYIIPFYPIILAIGKTSVYANVHMIVAIVIVIAEYIVCKTCDSAIYIAITSEICGLIKIVIFMRIIANYAQRKISDLIPLKLIGGVAFVSVLASLPPFFLFSSIELGKWLTLFVSLGTFLIDYYILCWVFKVSYRDILVGFLGNNTRFSVFVKLLP